MIGGGSAFQMYKRELNIEDYLLFSEKSLEYEINIKDP